MQAGSCARTCVRVRFGDVPVLLRNSKDQKVKKPKMEKVEKSCLGSEPGGGGEIASAAGAMPGGDDI